MFESLKKEAKELIAADDSKWQWLRDDSRKIMKELLNKALATGNPIEIFQGFSTVLGMFTPGKKSRLKNTLIVFTTKYQSTYDSLKREEARAAAEAKYNADQRAEQARFEAKIEAARR